MTLIRQRSTARPMVAVLGCHEILRRRLPGRADGRAVEWWSASPDRQTGIDRVDNVSDNILSMLHPDSLAGPIGALFQSGLASAFNLDKDKMVAADTVHRVSQAEPRRFAGRRLRRGWERKSGSKHENHLPTGAVQCAAASPIWRTLQVRARK